MGYYNPFLQYGSVAGAVTPLQAWPVSHYSGICHTRKRNLSGKRWSGAGHGADSRWLAPIRRPKRMWASLRKIRQLAWRRCLGDGHDWRKARLPQIADTTWSFCQAEVRCARGPGLGSGAGAACWLPRAMPDASGVRFRPPLSPTLTAGASANLSPKWLQKYKTISRVEECGKVIAPQGPPSVCGME